MTAMLDLPQQQTVVIDLRSQVQAEGTARAVALVLAAQGQVGLEEGEGGGDRRRHDTCGRGGNSKWVSGTAVRSTHTVQAGAALLHLLPAPVPLPLQLPLLLLQVGLQLCDAFAQTVLVQQAVRVLQLQAVTTM